MKSKCVKLLQKMLDWIEIVGNKLPHPATLFALLALIVLLLSWIGSLCDLTAIHPSDQSVITVNSLLNAEGLRWIYTHVMSNFIKFPPLSYVLMVMIGIGIAEGSGLFKTMIKALVMNAHTSLITAALVFTGVLSHLASEVGYVVLIPLGAMLFHAMGRHPMAGLAAAFCGVSGGFGANFLIGSNDVILAGLSEEAAKFVDAGMTVNPAANYSFMLVSAFMIVVVGTWVTEKIVEPRLGKYEGDVEKMSTDPLTAKEKKGLLLAFLGLVGIVILMALSVLPGGLLRNPETDEILKSPFFDGIIVGITAVFLIPGLIYGLVVGTIKNDRDFMKHIANSMKTVSGYIVLVFFAAQFVYFFKHSNLGIILAIRGAMFLESIHLTGIPLIVAFVLLSAFINLFMGSASAKWAIMAPVFIPMFMLLQNPYHPALTQAAFRIGDSVTNLVTPMMSYFALIVAFSQKYDEKYGIGTIIATMIPYTVVLTIIWLVLLCLWMATGFPLGPGGPLHL